MKLKLYSEKSWVPEGCEHLVLLDPFWGDDHYDPEGNGHQICAPYMKQGREIFEIVPTLEEADAMLLPIDWYQLLSRPAAMARAESLIEQAKAACKQVIIKYRHDAPHKGDWPVHAVVFRTAIQHRQRQLNEFIMPQWSRDYLQDLGGDLPVRPKEEIPVIGFCGFAPPIGLRPGNRWCKETARLMAHRLGLYKLFPNHMAHAARARTLKALYRSPLVKTNYIIRRDSAFDNPIGAFLPGGTVDAAARQRREFVVNILTSDYVLCARGWANCSIRFWETLSLGRIPVLVDTDCVLPFDFAIDWNKYRVLVKENTPSKAARAVREFHDALAPGEFEALQRDCRRLWEEWCSPLGFYKNMYRHLESNSLNATLCYPARLSQGRIKVENG